MGEIDRLMGNTSRNPKIKCVRDSLAKCSDSDKNQSNKHSYCTSKDPLPDRAIGDGKRIHFPQSLDRIKQPLDRYRPWTTDRSGLRLQDWNPSCIDCQPPKLGNFKNISVCQAKPNDLVKYFHEWDKFRAAHPRHILERCVYRDTDEYVKRRSEAIVACENHDDSFWQRELKPMNDREIKRLRLVTNNYTTLDDWKEDPQDELLSQYAVSTPLEYTVPDGQKR